MKWKEQNKNECIGIAPSYLINWNDNFEEVRGLYITHANKFDISTLKDLLMDQNIPEKDKLKIITDTCNESIRSFNKIQFTTGAWKRPDRFNEIPNFY